MDDCFRVLRTQSDTLKSSRLLSLHCIDLQTEVTVRLGDISCLEFVALLGHVSLPNRLRERRMVLLPNLPNTTRALQGVRTPALIDVSVSFDLKLEDDHEPMLVIWQFEVVTGMLEKALEPLRDYEGTNDTPTMPWLNLKNCCCNCTSWPRASLVLVDGGAIAGQDLQVESQGNSESESEGSDKETVHVAAAQETEIVGGNSDHVVSPAANNDQTFSIETFKLKGSSYHTPMQKALRQAQGLIAANEEVKVTIVEHSINVHDENALIAKIMINAIHEPIGYIPGKKVEKFKEALDHKDITSLVLKRVHRLYIPSVKDFMLFGYIEATKRGLWKADNKSYMYNS